MINHYSNKEGKKSVHILFKLKKKLFCFAIWQLDKKVKLEGSINERYKLNSEQADVLKKNCNLVDISKIF